MQNSRFERSFCIGRTIRPDFLYYPYIEFYFILFYSWRFWVHFKRNFIQSTVGSTAPQISFGLLTVTEIESRPHLFCHINQSYSYNILNNAVPICAYLFCVPLLSRVHIPIQLLVPILPGILVTGVISGMSQLYQARLLTALCVSTQWLERTVSWFQIIVSI